MMSTSNCSMVGSLHLNTKCYNEWRSAALEGASAMASLAKARHGPHGQYETAPQAVQRLCGN